MVLLDGISLSFLVLVLLIFLVCLAAYWLFPFSILIDDKFGNPKDITYRHEFLILFFMLFLPSLFLLVPTALYEETCEMKQVNFTVNFVYGNNYNTTHWESIQGEKSPDTQVRTFRQEQDMQYKIFCYNETKFDSSLKQNFLRQHSNLQRIFYVYLGITFIAYIFISIQNSIVKKRRKQE